MNVSIVIATCGREEWSELAWSRAYPSAMAQEGVSEVVVEHHPDLTVAQARNQAALSATGDWLCFLDADDELAPGYLEAMRREEDEFLGPDMVIGWERLCDTLLVPSVQYLDPHGHPIGVAGLPNASPPRPLWEVNVAVIGTLIPRDLFTRAGGFPDEPIFEDWALWLRLHYEHGAALHHVPGAVYRAWQWLGGGRNDQGDANGVYWRYRSLYEGRTG